MRGKAKPKQMGRPTAVQRPVPEQELGRVADRNLRLLEFGLEGHRIGFVGVAPKPTWVTEHDDVAHWITVPPPGGRDAKSEK